MDYFNGFDLGDMFSAFGIPSEGTEARNVLQDRLVKIYKTKVTVGMVNEPTMIFNLSSGDMYDGIKLVSTIRQRKSHLDIQNLKTYYMPRVIDMSIGSIKNISTLQAERNNIVKFKADNKLNVTEVTNIEGQLTQAKASVMYDMFFDLRKINEYITSGKLIPNTQNRKLILNYIKSKIESNSPFHKQNILYFKGPFLRDTKIQLILTEAICRENYKPFLLFMEWFANDPVDFKNWLKANRLSIVLESEKDGSMIILSHSDNQINSPSYNSKYVLKMIHLLDGKEHIKDPALKQELEVVAAEVTELDSGSATPLGEYTPGSAPIDNTKDVQKTSQIDTIDLPSNTGDSTTDEEEEFLVEEDAPVIKDVIYDPKVKQQSRENFEALLKVDNTKAAVELNEIHNYTDLKHSMETPEVKQMRKASMARFGMDTAEVVDLIKTHKIPTRKFKLHDNSSAYNNTMFDTYEDTYKEVLSNVDMENILLHPAKGSYPIFLENYEVQKVENINNKMEQIKVSYITHDGTPLEFTINKPVPVDSTGQLLINGSKKNIIHQDAPMPVSKEGKFVKVSSSYNKMFLELKGKYASSEQKRLIKLMQTYSKESGFLKVKTTEELDDFIYHNMVSYNLIHMNKHFAGLINNAVDIDFRGIRLATPQESSSVKDYILKAKYKYNEPLTILGTYKKHFVYHDPSQDIIAYNNQVLTTESFIRAALEENDPKLYKKSVSSKKETLSQINTVYVKLMGKSLPLIYVLMVAQPLKEILDILKEVQGLEYKIVSNEQLEKNPIVNDFGLGVIRLADKSIVLRYNNVANEMLLLPLVMTDLTEYESLNITTMMSDLVGNYNTQLYIENFIEFFIDPLTERVCKYLNIPYDFVGLLIYAAALFGSYKTSYVSDARNYRLLTTEEVINRVMYEVIAKELSASLARQKRGSRPKIVIPPDAVIKKLQELPNMAEANNLSPFRTIRSIRSKSYKGHMGMNMEAAYKTPARFFNKVSYGAETGGMAFTSNAGITKDLPVNVQIKSLIGEYDLKFDPEGIPAADAFSFIESYVPYLTFDSSARYIMTNAQFSHILSVESADPRLISSRADEIAIGLAPEFGYVAKQNAVVLDVNERFIVLENADKTVDVIPLLRINRNADKGYYTPNRMVLSKEYRKGDKISPTDIVAYNPLYYKKRSNGSLALVDGPLVWCLVADSDGVWEDSTLIGQALSKKLATRIVKKRARVLPLNTEIRDYNISIGQPVDPSDILFKYKPLSDDIALNEFFSNMESVELMGVESHHKGTLVDIRLYYRTGSVIMSESMKKFIQTIDDIQRVGQKMQTPEESTDGFQKSVYNHRPIRLEGGGESKMGGEVIRNGEILIEYYIEILDNAGPADKLVISRALKQEPTEVLNDDQLPRGVETGRVCEIIMDTYSNLARMTGGMILEGKLNSVIMHQAIRNRIILNRPPESGSLLDYKSCKDMTNGKIGYGKPYTRKPIKYTK